MASDDPTLRTEAHRIQYRLRSTFFYRKLKEYAPLALPGMVAELLPIEHLYSWEERERWGVGRDAFDFISTHPEFHLFQAFCHPKLLREHPRLLAYYRNIAALSQKSVGYLTKTGADIRKLEADTNNRRPLTDIQALELARLFNEHITLIIDSSLHSVTKDELYGLLLTSVGAQIDGAWRNAIGDEAEKVVQRLLVKAVRDRNLLAALMPKVGQAVEICTPDHIEEQLARIERYRGVLLTNRASILFSSDPDISLLDKNGATVCALEVKGGADPAGALERYGAAKKSFEAIHRQAPGVATILVASCITQEVHNRIQRDSLISAYWNLTELLSEDSEAHKRFIQQIFSYVDTESV
jgi:hypothetical protein